MLNISALAYYLEKYNVTIYYSIKSNMFICEKMDDDSKHITYTAEELYNYARKYGYEKLAYVIRVGLDCL